MQRSLTCVLSIIVSSLLPLVANAQAFRAYVASYGADTNPCTVAAPCRLLPAALNAIVNGGEVWMLDSANYNSATVTISKDASIMAVPGQIGSIVAAGGSPAIVISPGFIVALKNVSITNNANNPGNDGIQMTTGRLTVQDSVIAVVSNGISVNGTAVISVHNSSFRGGFRGVFVQGGASADISGSKLANVSYSLVAFAAGSAGTTTNMNITGCAITGGVTGVISAGELSGANVRVTVHDTTVANVSYGFLAGVDTGGTAVMSIANSAATLSGIGLYQYGGAVLESLGTNLVRSNGTNISGTVTPVSGS